MNQNGHTNKHKVCMDILLVLCLCMSVFFGSSLIVSAAYSINYKDINGSNFTLRVPYISDFEGQNIYNSSSLEGLHYELDYDLSGNFRSYNYYNSGFVVLDCYLYFYLGSNLNYTNLRNFSYVYTDDSPEYIYSNIDRCTVISLNDGFAFHFSLTILFDNYYDRVSRSFNVGNIHFDFDIQSVTSGSLDVQPFDRNNVDGFTFNSQNINRAADPYNNGLASIIAVAINNASDIESIISLLTNANTIDSNIFDELTYIYSTNQNIYTRLGLILEFLQDWQYQTDTDMQEILEELAEVVETNRDIINDLPVFDWDDYGHDISDLYYFWDAIVKPATPNTQDNNLVWSWVGLTWPVYIIGLVLIMGTISFVLYGKK